MCFEGKYEGVYHMWFRTAGKTGQILNTTPVANKF